MYFISNNSFPSLLFSVSPTIYFMGHALLVLTKTKTFYKTNSSSRHCYISTDIVYKNQTSNHKDETVLGFYPVHLDPSQRALESPDLTAN